MTLTDEDANSKVVFLVGGFENWSYWFTGGCLFWPATCPHKRHHRDQVNGHHLHHRMIQILTIICLPHHINKWLSTYSRCVSYPLMTRFIGETMIKRGKRFSLKKFTYIWHWPLSHGSTPDGVISEAELSTVRLLQRLCLQSRTTRSTVNVLMTFMLLLCSAPWPTP